MIANAKVIQCTTRDGMHARFRELDMFSRERAHANDPAQIEANFKEMARAHAANSDALLGWVSQGNKLPACYR